MAGPSDHQVTARGSQGFLLSGTHEASHEVGNSNDLESSQGKSHGRGHVLSALDVPQNSEDELSISVDKSEDNDSGNHSELRTVLVSPVSMSSSEYG